MDMPSITSAPTRSAGLVDRPRPRTFTAQDKLRVLAEVDRATGTPGVIGALVDASQEAH